jgi:hypothetical protein
MIQSATRWPPLPIAEWAATHDTLHMYTQIVGKVRMELSPRLNHWWHVPFYVTARGFTTSPIPAGTRTFQADFDFFDHALHVDTSTGERATLALGGSVREFYRDTMATLDHLGVAVTISRLPSEVLDPIPFAEDDQHSTYVPEQAFRYWQTVREIDTILKVFRARFTGKSSPVHFFWGGFDLAVSRFSGRPATPSPTADSITRFGYNAEQTSVGFWPGGRWIDGSFVDNPFFFAYAYPEPPGYRDAAVLPTAAFYDEQKAEFVLPYEAVRVAPDPGQMILDFAQSTYELGARLMDWPVASLELHD